MIKNSQKGFTLLEILGVLAIMSILLIAGAELADNKVQDIKDQNTAQYQNMVNNAAVRYIGSVSATITAANTEAAPRKITFAEIQAAGFIPSSFATATSNPYGQIPCVFAYRNPATPNQISSFVVSEGGQAIKEGRLPQIAALVGATGGYVSVKNPNLAVGAFGKWTKSVNQNISCSGVVANAGHVASQLYLDASSLTQNFLYRSSVPGFPEANTMNTPLIMNATITPDAACTTLGAIGRDNTGALMTCSGTPLTYKSSGSRFWKDSVTTKAALNATLCDATKMGETRVVTSPSVGSGPRAYSCNGATWEALSLDDSGNINIPGTLSVSKLTGDLEIVKTRNRGDACVSPDKAGSLARDSTGLLLSCQNISGQLLWKKALGETGGYRGLYDYLEGQTISCSFIHPMNGKPIFSSVTIQNGAWNHKHAYQTYNSEVAFKARHTTFTGSSQFSSEYYTESLFDLIQNKPSLTVHAWDRNVTSCTFGGCTYSPRIVRTCVASFPSAG